MRMPPIALLVLALLAATSANAGEWVAESVGGKVLVFHHGAWVALNSGDLVGDDAVVRTGSDGRVRFRRDKRLVDLGAGVQDQITHLASSRLEQGAAAADVDSAVLRRVAPHAAYVAAVVKG